MRGGLVLMASLSMASEGSALILSGAEAVKRLRRRELMPLRSPDSLQEYIRNLCERRLESDPLFAAQCRVRDIRRANRDALEEAYQRIRDTKAAYQATAASSEIERLQRLTTGKTREVEGRRKSKKATADPADLEAAEEALQALQGELQAMEESCSELAHWTEAEAQFAALESDLGLTELRAGVDKQKKSTGRNAQVKGFSFESEVLTYTKGTLMPRLAQQDGVSLSCMKALSNVSGGQRSLGLANAELDVVVVQLLGEPEQKIQPVRALAIVEAKRNANDVGKAFEGFQSTLGFLTGDETCFNPSDWCTKRFRTGRFSDVEFCDHHEGGVDYRFDPTAFELFAKSSASSTGMTMPSSAGLGLGATSASTSASASEGDSQLFVDRLHFVTQSRSLDGFDSGTLGFLTHFVASDIDFDAEDSEKVSALFHRLIDDCKFSTGDVLSLLETREEWMDQLAVLDRN